MSRASVSEAIYGLDAADRLMPEDLSSGLECIIRSRNSLHVYLPKQPKEPFAADTLGRISGLYEDANFPRVCRFIVVKGLSDEPLTLPVNMSGYLVGPMICSGSVGKNISYSQYYWPVGYLLSADVDFDPSQVTQSAQEVL